MAKYADYQTDTLDEEIQDAAQQSSERAEVVPERFKGKSAEEIAKSYVELEKLNSRQAQDLGEMRKQVDQLVREFEESKAEPVPPEPTVSVDDIYASPEEAIERVVRKVIEPTLAEQKQERHQRAIQERMAHFDNTYDGWRDVVTGEEFQTWIRAKPYRARMAAAADNHDLEAATELLEQYYDLRQGGSADRASKDKLRNQQLQDATLESGGAAYSEPPQTFSRTQLISRRVAAKRGDQEAIDWLRANHQAISDAYEDGRIRD